MEELQKVADKTKMNQHKNDVSAASRKHIELIPRV